MQIDNARQRWSGYVWVVAPRRDRSLADRDGEFLYPATLINVTRQRCQLLAGIPVGRD
jgi:hypothetical protein